MNEQLKEIDWTKPVKAIEWPHIVPRFLGQITTVYMIRTEKDVCDGCCKIRSDRYVDQYGRKVTFGPQIIENVPDEPEYTPLRPGDRLSVDDREYILVRVGSWWSLMDMSSGIPWKSLECNHFRDFLLLPDFEELLGGKAEQWQQIYKTVRRQGN
jgi:hypothetical protein